MRKTLNGLESLEGSRCLDRLWIDFESLGKLGKVESLECLEWLEKSESFGCLNVGMKRHFFRGMKGSGVEFSSRVLKKLQVCSSSQVLVIVFIITFHLIFLHHPFLSFSASLRPLGH